MIEFDLIFSNDDHDEMLDVLNFLQKPQQNFINGEKKDLLNIIVKIFTIT
jgi:hypothetical protein